MSVSADRMYLQLEDGTILAMRAVNGVIQVSSNGIDGWTDLTGAGTVDSVVPGSGIDIDATDPANPIVAAVPEVHITTATGAVDSISVAGLVPATEGDYDVFAVFQIAQANTSILIRPEDSATDCSSASTNILNGGVVSGAEIQISRNAQSPMNFAAGNIVTVTGRIYAKVGRVRVFDLQWTLIASGAVSDIGYLHGIWNDTTTPLTRTDWHSDVVGGIGAGSFVRLTAVANSA